MATLKCPVCGNPSLHGVGNTLGCKRCGQIIHIGTVNKMPIQKDVYCPTCNQKMVSEKLIIGKKSFLIYKCSNGHVKSMEKGYGEIFGQIGDDAYELLLEHKPQNTVGTFVFNINGKPQTGITKIILTITHRETLMSIERRLDG